MLAGGIIGIVLAVFVLLAMLIWALLRGKRVNEAPSNRNLYVADVTAKNGPHKQVISLASPSSTVLPSMFQTMGNTVEMSSVAFGSINPRNNPIDPIDPFDNPVEEVRTFRANGEGRYVEVVPEYPGYGIVSRTPREAVRFTEGRRGGGAASEHVLRRSETGAWRYAENNDGSEFIVKEKSRRSRRRKRASSRR